MKATGPSGNFTPCSSKRLLLANSQCFRGLVCFACSIGENSSSASSRVSSSSCFGVILPLRYFLL